MNEKVLGTLAAGLKKLGEGLNHDWLKPTPVRQFRYRDSCQLLVVEPCTAAKKDTEEGSEAAILEIRKTMSSALTLSGGMPILVCCGEGPGE